jgi:hypothetical protein
MVRVSHSHLIHTPNKKEFVNTGFSFIYQTLKLFATQHWLLTTHVPPVPLFYYFISMGVRKQLAEYLYLRKPDPDRPKTQFVKYMHGINRLSLLLFLLALIILVIRLTLGR